MITPLQAEPATSPRWLHLNVIQRSRIVSIRRAFNANHVAGLQSDTAHNVAG
jgi:hypothetical protein